MADNPTTMTVVVDADTRGLRRELAEVSDLGRQFGRAMTGAFEAAAIRGRGLGDVLRSLALRLSDLVLRAAFKPLEKGLGSLLSGLFGGGLAFANGAAFQRGMPVPFASGGVIQSPIGFPLANGRFGVAGERGPEAILPLARGADGRLGVRAAGQGGTVVNIQIATPDVESFRRSEAQVAAILARAVGHGSRNL